MARLSSRAIRVLLVLVVAAGLGYAAVKQLARPAFYLEGRAVRFIPAPPDGHIVAATWLTRPNMIVEAVDFHDNATALELYTADPVRGDARPLELSLGSNPSCYGRPRDAVRALPDGRVAYIGDCYPLSMP